MCVVADQVRMALSLATYLRRKHHPGPSRRSTGVRVTGLASCVLVRVRAACVLGCSTPDRHRVPRLVRRRLKVKKILDTGAETMYTCADGSGTFNMQEHIRLVALPPGIDNTGPVSLHGGTGAYVGLTGHGVDNGVNGVGHISGNIVQP